MIRWIASLAKQTGIPFLMLFARDYRLYEQNGFEHKNNVLRWTMIDKHKTIGIAEEPLEELMIKTIGTETWPEGLIDLLGYQF